MASAAANSIRKAISIPQRIKRSPTDLLKALSKTVEIDPLSTSYNLIDDTFLTPTTNIEIRRAYLAKASGIKAARFMIEKYPDAFFKDDCVPHVSGFFPERVFTEKELKYPSESLIYSLISWGKFKKAFEIYNNCKDQGIEVSESCKNILLDYLCIYNSNDLPSSGTLSEEWYNRVQKLETYNQLSKWNKDQEAQLMFNELKEKTSTAYCSLIKGMATYLEVQGAQDLFKEMISKNLKPDLATMNAITSLIAYSSISNENKHEQLLVHLKDYKKYNYMPNLKTFNNCLLVVKSMGYFKHSVELTLNILKEMEMLKIEPSLATWSLVLSIFYPSKELGIQTGVLKQVVDEVEKKDKSENGLEWRDVNDSLFFKIAMDKCLITYEHLEQAHRIHRILMRNNNVKFLNDHYSHNKYFETYMLTVIKFDTTENVINEWRRLTPYTLIRNMKLVERMVYFVVDNQIYDFVPEIWSNFLELKMRRSVDYCSKIIENILKIMIEYKGANPDLVEKYANIAETMLKNFPFYAIETPNEEIIDTSESSTVQIFEYQWTGKMLTSYIELLLNANRVNKAWSAFETYLKKQSKVTGELGEPLIKNFFDALYNTQQVEQAYELFNYALLLQLPTVRFMIDKLLISDKIDPEKKIILKQAKSKFVH